MAGDKGQKALSGAVASEKDKAAAAEKRERDRDGHQKLLESQRGKKKKTKPTERKHVKHCRNSPREKLGQVMTKASMLTLINKPLYRGHGLEIRKGTDGQERLWCSLCKVQLTNKISQHLGSSEHRIKRG